MLATEKQKQNQTKRANYSLESLERAKLMVDFAKACPCRACVGAASLALEGAQNATADARLWAGRLYGHEHRHGFTMRLEVIAKLTIELPSY